MKERDQTDEDGSRKDSPQEVVIGDGTSDLQRARLSSRASADLETAITKSGVGKFNLALILLSIPASFTNGFVTGSMSFVVPAASADLGLTPTAKAMLQSACYAGMVSSGFFWGFLSDAFGRKKLLVVGYVLDCLMNILAGVFPILPLMIIFKCLSGFVICGPFSIFTTYISEVFPSKQRHIAVLSTAMFSASGQIILAGLASWIIPVEVPSQIPFKSWQLFQIACCIPSFISALGCLFFVESPKFLADKGDKEGALKICRTIYTINTGKLSTTYPIKKLNHLSRNSEKEKSKFARFLNGMVLFRPPFIQKAIIIFIIHLGAAVSLNTLRLWLPEMLTLVNSSELEYELGLCPLLQAGHMAQSTSNSTSVPKGGQHVYTDMMIVNLGVTVSSLFFLLIVGYIQKKKILLCCALVSGFCSVLITFISASHVYIPASVFISFYNIVIFCNIDIMVEVFPTRIRATSVSVLMLVARVGILAVNFLIANLIYTYCIYFFYGMGLLSLVLATMTIFVPHEPIDEAPQNHLS